MKHFVVLQGEFIAPEKIQNVYLRSPFIAQVFVYGNSFKVSFTRKLGSGIQGPAIADNISRDISIDWLLNTFELKDARFHLD